MGIVVFGEMPSLVFSGFFGAKLQKTSRTAVGSMHVYDVRPRKDKRGVDLISDALPFGRLWYGEPKAVAIGYAQSYSRSHAAVIRVYDATGNVIETHEHKGVSVDSAS